MTQRIHTIVRAVLKTYEIDESGDTNLHAFLEEHYERWTDSSEGRGSTSDMLVAFLEWANGPNWETFLRAAEIGDVPPKGH